MYSSAMTLPNMITVLRFCAVPVIVYFMLVDYWQPAFWLFIAAGICDGIDGLIARHFNQQSELGAYLDPIADKALLIAVFTILAFDAAIPLWIVVLMIARDMLIIAAVVVSSLMGAALKIEPIFISKATTVAQICLAASLFASKAWKFDVGIYGQSLLFITAALTLISGMAYAALWFQRMAQHGDT